jgi:hypothetical protein
VKSKGINVPKTTRISSKVSKLVAVMLGIKTKRLTLNHFVLEREIIIKSENQFAIKFTFIVLSTRPKKEKPKNINGRVQHKVDFLPKNVSS